jgi:hypothetical protein
VGTTRQFQSITDTPQDDTVKGGVMQVLRVIYCVSKKKVISVRAEGERNAVKQQLLFYPYVFPEMRIDTS